ncbi:short-chain dehydrogenase/reductase [Mesorhizobium tianshanense]|uniref:NAD(P)-dependent dehydrogenase (Short-subunit alcohol dehydrogenase family) n=1 Tax=Mesorhizobium tianshanense TaxID=39844 RepID=A0A562NP88_9HYPH|nr:SDR family oxidoreductase [Mesorhizobium tianshanense]TWI34004.1 NAD(P)-dependent dehydrogenase (short-subunit alcohol dehydrogenase family) [Mesorhizobium tianshanense]GLS34572.1 short-chain dehydrogenase/reductase [Mesorhizobium tianshanense]
MTGRLQDKVAIITGAGRGIGAAIARAFHREGAKVVVAEIDKMTGEAVASDLSPNRASALFVPCDVRQNASVEAVAALAKETFGRIDILVNNAGINVFHEPLETSEAEWRRCFDIDLDGVWRMSKAVLPAMLDRGAGSIVNIASTHSFSIIPGCFPYPVAKHGLLGLTRALGIDYAARGVRVNAIAPGYIETQIAVDYWNTFPDPEAERRRTYDLHPQKRIGKPEEVAMTALFLASDEAPFINAACIVVDGGRSVLYHD